VAAVGRRLRWADASGRARCAKCLTRSPDRPRTHV